MPVNIELLEAMNYEEDGQFGHRIQLQVVVPNRDGARLDWLERTGRPYVDGMPADEWVNMLRLAPDSLVFEPWQDSEGETGGATLVFRDPPSIRREPNAMRVLDLWIVMLDGGDEEGNGGECWGVWQARQTLRCDAGGRIVEQLFVIVDDRAGSDGDPPYPKGYRPH